MEKGGSFIGFLLVLALIVLSVLTFLFFYKGDGQSSKDFLPISNQSENESLVEIVNETIPPEQNNSSNNSLLDIKEIHWYHMPLNYKINDEETCGETPVKNIKKALEIIENSTNGVVGFRENASEADIEVNCVDGIALLAQLNNSIKCDKKEFDYDKKIINPIWERLITQEDFLVNVSLTERNITENSTKIVYSVCYIPSSDSQAKSHFESLKERKPVVSKNIIIKAKINIYKSGGLWNPCSSFPARDVHSTLHALGFDHSEVPEFHYYYGWSDINKLKDVMFPDLYCSYQKKLDEKYPSCLKKIYSDGDVNGSCEGISFLNSS